MANLTTLFYGGGYTPATASEPDQTPTPIPLPNGTASTALPGGFILYLPIDIKDGDIVPINDMIEELSNDQDLKSGDASAWAFGIAGSSTVVGSTATMTGSILNVPIISELSTKMTLHMASETLSNISTSLVTDARAEGTMGTPEGSNLPPTTNSPASSQSAETAKSSAMTTTASLGGISSGTPFATAASTAGPDNEGGISQSTFNGAVAGGVIAGLLVGAVAGLAILWCFRRRSTPSGSTQIEYHDHSGPSALSGTEKAPRSVVEATPAMGWRKHLPDDRDDRTVQNAFQSLFHHIEMHVEGFYGKTLDVGPSDETIAGLQKLANDSSIEIWRDRSDWMRVLEAVLTRWIVHSISLRSAQVESLLPAEYNSLPKLCGWHMERPSRGGDVSSESRKGVTQALSEWRKLTGFIRQEPLKDDACQRELKAKIDEAVSLAESALAPWKLAGKGSKARSRSLVSILEEASRAGIMLFQQRSLFTFDWSPPQGTDGGFVVAPALVKEMDDNGEILPRPQTLVAAT